MADIEACFADDARFAAALAFERELAAALADHGVIVAEAAAAIATACDRVDTTGLAEAAEHAGTLAIPLVERLRACVPVEHRAAVHLGATSQDVADTVLVLQIDAASKLVDGELDGLLRALASSARVHVRTPVMARTLLQPAEVISLGVRFATWYAGIVEARARLDRELARVDRIQLGGAVGTLATLGPAARLVRATLARRLGLYDAPSWHARRDAIAGVGCALAIATGAIGKLARDVSLLMQLGEVSEPHVAGRGGSSAMPGKHNPTSCRIALSAALRAPGLAATLVAAMPQELERGLGGWQAEPPVIAELFSLAFAATRAMREATEGLEIVPASVTPGEHAPAIEAAVLSVDELLTTPGTPSRPDPEA
jgi:3-carboxy-cis,cis-muconate cycloisomerase